MPKALDITNQRFGKLVAIKKIPSRSGNTYWLCKCDCGEFHEVQTGHLVKGLCKSCGKCRNSNPNISTEKLEKVCPICQKTFKTFAYNRIYCYECSPEQKDNSKNYQKTKQRAIKHQLILYKGGKCERCGYNKCEGALQFHHRNPKEKEFTLSAVNLSSKNLSMEDLYAEVDKCELLCANCHSEEHYQ